MGPVKSILVAILLGNCVFLALNFLAYRVSLDFHLSTHVGRLDDPYGWQNLSLPSLLRFLLALNPAVLIAIAAYKWLRCGRPQFSLWRLLAVVTLITIPMGLASGDAMELSFRPARAMLSVAYMLALSGISIACIAIHRSSGESGSEKAPVKAGDE